MLEQVWIWSYAFHTNMNKNILGVTWGGYLENKFEIRLNRLNGMRPVAGAWPWTSRGLFREALRTWMRYDTKGFLSAKRIKYTPSDPVPLIWILISYVYFLLRLGQPSGHCPSSFLTKTLCEFLISPYSLRNLPTPSALVWS